MTNEEQANAIVAQANALMEKGEGEKAFELFRQAASLGSGEAMYVLYSILEAQDDNDPQTKNAANIYLQKAANAGSVDAQVILAVSYESGDGFPQDYAKAAEWFLKAARQGDPDAQYGIARLMLIGEGVKEDEKEGMKWLTQASEQGQENAIKYLDLINKAKTKRNVKIAGSIAKAVFKGIADSLQ